jgi:hypothetical protein
MERRAVIVRKNSFPVDWRAIYKNAKTAEQSLFLLGFNMRRTTSRDATVEERARSPVQGIKKLMKPRNRPHFYWVSFWDATLFCGAALKPAIVNWKSSKITLYFL